VVFRPNIQTIYYFERMIPLERKWLAAYEPGISDHLEYPRITLPEVLRNISQKFPNNTAMVYLDHLWSYRELNTLVSQMSNLLISLSIKPGDRVGIHLVNSPQFVIAYYGLLRAGAIAVPINPNSSGDDFQFIVKNSGLKLLVTSCHSLLNIQPKTCNTAKILVTDPYNVFNSNQTYSLDHSADVIRLEQVLFSQLDSDPGLVVDPDAYANLQYTGGTTGRSKGAILSHYNLVANALQVRHWFKNVYLDGEGRFLCVIPFYHIYGMTTTMNFVLVSGSTMLIHHKFELPELVHTIEKYKPNLFMAVPAMYGAFVMRQEHPDMRSIKACMSGSAPLPLAIQQKFEQLSGGKLVEGYGLTEASPVVSCNPIYGIAKNGSIGLPLPDTEVMLVNPATGAEIVTPGEVGELLVKGPQVMHGYWEQPEETALTLKNGWLHTGDLVRMDEAGYIYIADRLKDMIISGGEKIYPREVEDLLYTHPAVKETAVVGVTHPLRGEIPSAFVVLKEGCTVDERELKRFCAKHLTKYKVPHSFKFVEELPRSAVGKILKSVLRESTKELEPIFL
jgi:long-chain acyl-CoA synthetase